MGRLDGHCLCGSSGYTCGDAEPVLTFICHCRDCQRSTGGPASLNVVVPRDAVELSGDGLGAHKTYAEDGGAERERWFCSRCGSPLVVLLDDLPFAVIKAGTLDDPSGLEPTQEIWTDSAHAWFHADAERVQHARGLPSG